MSPSWGLVALVDRLRSAVPLVVVGALAAYTWWLVQSAPGADRDSRPKPPISEPDYQLSHATIERFDAQGRRVSMLRGIEINHFADGDRLVIQELNLVAETPQGQHLQAMAREGSYRGVSAVVNLQGQARVTARPGPDATGRAAQGPVVFEGEALALDTRAHQLASLRPIRLSSPDGVMTGASLSHDARTGITVVGGRVRGHFNGGRR